MKQKVSQLGLDLEGIQQPVFVGGERESGASPHPHGASLCLSCREAKNWAAAGRALTPLLLHRKPAYREPPSYVVVVFFLELPGESWGTPHKLDLNARQGAPSLAGSHTLLPGKWAGRKLGATLLRQEFQPVMAALLFGYN